MTIFDLTIGRIIYLIETLDKILFEAQFEILRSLGIFLSLFITGLMIFFWIKIETMIKDETKFWQSLLKNLKDFFFLKRSKKNFNEIKAIFYKDKNKGLIEINNFLDFVLEIFGQTNSLEEKLNKISTSILPNLEELKKAVEIVKIINLKLKNNEEINLTDDDYLLIFHEYEKALLNLNLINEEDFLAKNLK
jgi:hypothetical protein